MKITYWADYACPFCYIGETRLKKAVKELGMEDEVEMDMKSYQLDPAAPSKSNGNTLTRFAKKYSLSKDEASKRIAGISNMGRKEGLDFNYATTLFTNTMDAHRLTKYAKDKEPDKAMKLSDLLMDAYFGKNKELADKNVLKEIAEEAGLNMKEAEKVIQDNTLYEKEVRQDEFLAMQLGITAVPFFIIGGYGIAGAESTERIKNVLKKAKADVQKIQVEATGDQCGPNGCSIAAHKAGKDHD